MQMKQNVNDDYVKKDSSIATVNTVMSSYMHMTNKSCRTNQILLDGHYVHHSIFFIFTSLKVSAHERKQLGKKSHEVVSSAVSSHVRMNFGDIFAL